MDLRREPARDLDVGSDPVLLAAIRDEIERDGPMTFARFMTIALYDPARGYYRGAVARPGRAGDFLTAPEAHPLFGRSLARFARGVHAALGAGDRFTIREAGAGTGALAAPLVGELLASSSTDAVTSGPIHLRYLVDEIEPARVDALRSRLANIALPPGASVEVSTDDGAAINGLVVANEVLDALPTHRVVRRGDDLREIRVGLAPDGRPVDVETEPSTDALAERLAADGVVLADGQLAEVCLALEGWIGRAAAGLGRGVLLVIDYGHPSDALYDSRRRAAGTLATYLGHQVGDDPYRAIGRQDLTAHVDFTAVERAAAREGLDHVATSTQGAFLAGLGAGEQLVAEQTAAGATLQGYLEARSALVRMIDPGAMGGFGVLVFGRDLPIDARLPGLADTATRIPAAGPASAAD